MAIRHRSRASFRRLYADLLRPGLTVDPAFADAILDRLGHNAHRLALDGPSVRDPKTAKSDTTSAGAECGGCDGHETGDRSEEMNNAPTT